MVTEKHNTIWIKNQIPYLLCRLRRTNFAMRNRGSRQRRRNWSSSWNLWMHSLVSCLPLLQSLLHLRCKAKPTATSWYLVLAIQELQCGNSCHLLQWIPHRIMFSVHQLPKLALYNSLGQHFGSRLYPFYQYLLGFVSSLLSILTGPSGDFWLYLAYDTIMINAGSCM